MKISSAAIAFLLSIAAVTDSCGASSVPGGEPSPVAGGTLYRNRCVPDHNDWPITWEPTEEACHARCPPLPECKTVDYTLSNKLCHPSKAGIEESVPYANCIMWVKDLNPAGAKGDPHCKML